MLYVLVFALSILCFSAWSSVAPYGASKINNSGPHGLSEIVYAYTSATGNNGSAFAGITVNTYWYNTTLGLAMLIGRFLMIIPMMAIAGNLAMQEGRAAFGRELPGLHAAVRGAADRRDLDRRRVDVLSRCCRLGRLWSTF